MLFLPKRRERYISALRIYTQKMILKYGINKKQLENLKKITIAGIISGNTHSVPVDIISYADSVLGASVIVLLRKGIYLSTSLSGNSVCCIDTNLFTAFILELLRCSIKNNYCEIIVKAEIDTVFITTNTILISNTLKSLIKKLGGAYFRLINDNLTAVSIPAKPSHEKPIQNPDEWILIIDRLSPVNAFLSHL